MYAKLIGAMLLVVLFAATNVVGQAATSVDGKAAQAGCCKTRQECCKLVQPCCRR